MDYHKPDYRETPFHKPDYREGPSVPQIHAPFYSWKGKRSRAQCSCGWQSTHWFTVHQNAREEWGEHRLAVRENA